MLSAVVGGGSRIAASGCAAAPRAPGPGGRSERVLVRLVADPSNVVSSDRDALADASATEEGAHHEENDAGRGDGCPCVGDHSSIGGRIARSGQIGPEASRAPRRLQAPRGDLRGEPLLRQPVRRAGARSTAKPSRARPTRRGERDAGRPVRRALRLPAAERREPDQPAAVDDLHRTRAHGIAASHFTNEPFSIDDYIAPTDKTCPAPGVFGAQRRAEGLAGALPGGCTARPGAPLLPGAVPDRRRPAGPLRHRVRRGRPDPWATTTPSSCPSTATCTRPGAPQYVIADHFFQAAFGGSFLNHQWLIAARSPLDTSDGASGSACNSVLDSNGIPTRYPLYRPTGPVPRRPADPGVRRPRRSTTPSAGLRRLRRQHDPAAERRTPRSGGPQLPLIDDTDVPQHRRPAHRGRHLAGTGTPAAGTTPRPGTPARCSSTTTSRSTTSPPTPPASPGARTCRTRRSSSRPRRTGTLPAVSFVKPYGAENEHPGYASEPDGSDHLVDLLKTITDRAAGRQHPGRRDLRRVRRPVGPRPAARTGRRPRRARRSGAPAPGSRRW